MKIKLPEMTEEAVARWLYTVDAHGREPNPGEDIESWYNLFARAVLELVEAKVREAAALTDAEWRKDAGSAWTPMALPLIRKVVDRVAKGTKDEKEAT